MQALIYLEQKIMKISKATVKHMKILSREENRQ